MTAQPLGANETMMLTGKKVLLAEDEYFIAQDMALAFAAAAAAVVGPAATVAQALRLVMMEPHLDGAVLDINLKGEMVYPVADALAARGVPFVFATGYNREEIPHRFSHFPRCEKPVGADKVAMALFGQPGKNP